jgi:quercetin dioxygenase-like cupin family protein
MTADARTRTVRLHAEDVEALAWEHLHGVRDAETRVLWRERGSLAGILRLGPGARLDEHVHSDGNHHVYVLSGRCGVGDEVFGSGSYVHVPAGEAHALRAEGPEQCVVLYLYVVEPPR